MRGNIVLFPFAVPSLLLGCGDGLPRQATYQVSGKVLLDGKPVPGATLVFHPVDPTKFKWKEVAQGRTDDQGNFTLTTYITGDGAPAGEYRVGIALLEVADDDGADQVKHSRQRPRIPRKYASHETSQLTAKVDVRGTTLEPFQLQTKP